MVAPASLLTGQRWPDPSLQQGAITTTQKVVSAVVMAFAAVLSFVFLPEQIAILISGGLALLFATTCCTNRSGYTPAIGPDELRVVLPQPVYVSPPPVYVAPPPPPQQVLAALQRVYTGEPRVVVAERQQEQQVGLDPETARAYLGWQANPQAYMPPSEPPRVPVGQRDSHGPPPPYALPLPPAASQQSGRVPLGQRGSFYHLFRGGSSPPPYAPPPPASVGGAHPYGPPPPYALPPPPVPGQQPERVPVGRR